MTRPTRPRSRFDPDDWGASTELGARMVADLFDHLSGIESAPVWRPVPEETRRAFDAPLPRQGAPAEEVYDEFLASVLPYNMGNVHPRFWGWVNGTGTWFTALADFLAAAMNPNVHGSDTAPVYVERQVVAWLREMLGYPAEASGVLLSGCSMANYVGLLTALHARAPVDVAMEGLGALPEPMIVYASDQTHLSIRKAIRMMGLGERALRTIPSDGDLRIDLGALRAAIARDRAEGARPFCVVGNAGTVDAGAFDPLAELADLARGEDLWLHVDGAFGAAVALSPDLRSLVDGIERADSLAFDLHKWFHVPYEAGGVLVRDAEAHRDAFWIRANYFTKLRGGIASIDDSFGDYGPQLSRGFRALKVWMGLKHHGVERYREAIERNVEQARYLTRRIEDEDELETLAPVVSNIVCLRYRVEGWSEERLDDLNERVLVELQESGLAVPTQTRIGGRFAIRVAITNHRSRLDDFDLLVDAILERGQAALRIPGTDGSAS